ncbi:MAG TPA: glutamine-hydrolyzing carbamoyl-phosphate synthase small subunit [Opitutaceae bacterium]|jgi:carbamoyl-phosphate synthase small subunit|nr:glutamine-hydrolyzing carbamoyl-phosphate synthase small subunit [Opitutaceae bacterium]HOD47716.1 glutamine-hydrolyzing carbamoyl-phosphate synthase small subunit [Opitutaceae bacterium]HOF10920.1 glutamine-hydrolyzing carbamoyl-phosphate synthase small subunit [Opitutaceae bacterium]HOG92278.1 glutamine-hydrolyzing carbamoyl-phosphate synthase small subunit [Opitutaceae bacterium]HOR25874.1 glutamine-hydrolyzing carbamoyl-phosphate synthase small subunit [Opitutaceae bacterium]
MSTSKPAVLALEDGSVYHGLAFGADATIAGECVFNTSMTGYQEIITDPSYFGQIVTMTAVQIGNYGVNDEDSEASAPKASGFVVRELSPIVSNWRANLSLDAYLKKYGIPGISEIDTRALTKKLRVDGAMKCCLSTLPISDEDAVKRARSWQDMAGSDYVKDVSCKAPYIWSPTAPENHNAQYLPVGTSFSTPQTPARRFKVAAFDFGAKYTIFRKLVRHGFDVQVFPASASAEQIREYAPDGVFLSNGPGDPAALPYIHKTVTALVPDFPIFGICLGHQMITHALGGKTFKLKFGHRGGNQPVKNIETGKVSITAQNHGFAADPQSLEKAGAVVTEINLNDNTVEGLRHKELPIFSVQYHPEAAPGPNDADPLFLDFYRLIEKRKAGKI